MEFRRVLFRSLCAEGKAVRVDDVSHGHLVVRESRREIGRKLGNIAADAVSNSYSEERRLRKVADRGERHVADGSLGSVNVSNRQLRDAEGDDTRLHLSALELVLGPAGPGHSRPLSAEESRGLNSSLWKRLGRYRVVHLLRIADQRAHSDDSDLEMEAHIPDLGAAIKARIEIRAKSVHERLQVSPHVVGRELFDRVLERVLCPAGRPEQDQRAGERETSYNRLSRRVDGDIHSLLMERNSGFLVPFLLRLGMYTNLLLM